MKLQIRDAIPGDYERAIPLIYSSGPYAFDYVFLENGKTAQDFLRFAFRKRGNTFSYSNHAVACSDELVIGTIVHFEQPEFSFLSLGTAIAIMQFYGWNSFKVLLRGILMESLIQPPRRNRLYLGHIAVDEKFRRRGIGSDLIRFCQDKFGNRKILALDVSAVNDSACSVYRKFGFKEIEKRDFKDRSAKIPSHFYMETNL
ncbi:GNAT family N-acetyltransferase [Leptospira perolatii]|uniref:GNAT family N-acetyltransferase n=1 Tax=Leptospira perolatii TaxID=2023191 RepID=UPI001FAFB9B9|nr:N-acetyltransferase [Leptospira perolatii]